MRWMEIFSAGRSLLSSKLFVLVVDNIQIYFVISLWILSIKRKNGGREPEVASSRYNKAAVKV